MRPRKNGARSWIHGGGREDSRANDHRSYGDRNSLHEHAYASNRNERFVQDLYYPHVSSDVEFEEQRSKFVATRSNFVAARSKFVATRSRFAAIQSRFAAECGSRCLDDYSLHSLRAYFAQSHGAPLNAD